MTKHYPIFFAFFLLFVTVQGQVSESKYYPILNMPLPQHVIAEAGGVCVLPNGSVGVATRRGDIFIIENPESSTPVVRHFAGGMHEILGLRYYNGAFYCVQRTELTRVEDLSGDGVADRYETVAELPASGNYHEYSYGPVIDEHGHMFVTLNVGFFSPDWWRGRSRAKWRGWALRIDPDTGEVEPWATGMRSPCGLGLIDGEFFYADNQGDWHGSGGLIHVEKGDFTGHPAGLVWTEEPDSPLDLTQEQLYARIDPREADESGKITKPENIEDEEVVPLIAVEKEFPEIKTPAVWLPHGVLGISNSEILEIPEDIDFGPFGGQILIGDQGQSKISRVFLEKVDGVYQGGAVLFREGFKSGVLRMAFLGNSLYVGQTNRGWGSTGPEPYGMERVVWTGQTPFEILDMEARPDGFVIRFTKPVDRESARNLGNYQMTEFIYKYHPVYGSPAVNREVKNIKGVRLAEDGMSLRLAAEGMREGYIQELVLGLKSVEGEELLHNTTYYTLNRIPRGESLRLNELQGTVRNTDGNKPSGEVEKNTGGASRKAIAKRTTEKPSHWDKVDKVLRIGTRPGLKFDTEEITVQAGDRIQLVLENSDDMPHNLLIVQPGTADAVGQSALRLGIKGLEMDYVPDMDEVLFHTKLLQPGTSDTIYLQVPEEPGEYVFVCTYPGHYLSMRGVIRVLE